MKKQWKGSVMLLLAAMIWGAAFVAQSTSLEYLQPFTIQAVRFCMSGLVLLPFALIGERRRRKISEQLSVRKTLVRGIICGVMLFAACSFQQFGLIYTSVGKSGFITALYILMVPLFGIALGKQIGWQIWCCVGIAVAGLYFLSGVGAGSFNIGDVLTLVCAGLFAVQILYVDHVGSSVNGITLSCIQAFSCAAASAVCMLLFETPQIDRILQCWLPLCYAGILSGGAAYTLQIVGQQNCEPTLASLLMSLESVFAALFGLLLLGQTLSSTELLGCALMFGAIIFAQIPLKKKKTA